MIEKNSWSLYVLCWLLVVSPIYFVWSKFPEIVSECEAKAEQQLMNISMLGALPFIGVVVYTVVLWVKKGFPNYF